ncbi:MAG: TolC family protein, partial [Desulfohalobiaceae bacterium]
SDNFQLLETAEENAAALDDAVLIELALQNRADLLASEGRQESAALRENVFEDRTRPSLDMGLEAGYEGLEEGESYGNMFEAPGSNVRGMSWQLSLTYEFPVQNRQARGRMLQQRVERRRQALQSRELTRDIKSNVHNAMSVLRQNILELENTRQTERLYEKAVENQQMKYRLGMGTLLDLIDTQDNLTQARMSKIEAYFKCSRALTSLKYQTATLVSFVQDEARVELKSLTDLPD